jgi:hypothetical protein
VLSKIPGKVQALDASLGLSRRTMKKRGLAPLQPAALPSNSGEATASRR